MNARECRDCGVQEGQFHEPNCCVEECPFCHEQLISCDCCYTLQEINPKVEPAYSQGLTDEQVKVWEKMLKEKGLVPYGKETRYEDHKE